MKLKVLQWQYDEIAHLVWRMKGSKEWLEANLDLAHYTYRLDEFPRVYIFFGPENRMEQWRRREGFDKRDVKSAMAPDKIEGLRGIPVRVYDLDGDPNWFYENFMQPEIQRTLQCLVNMQSTIGIVERLD